MFFYIFALIFIILEVSLLSHLRIFSVKPNLILFIVTIFSFYFNFDKLKVILFCLFCGLLKDIFSITPIGTHMLAYMILGVTLSYASKRFLRYNWLFIIPLFIFASVGQYIIYAIIYNLFFDYKLSLFYIPWKILITELIYGFLTFFLFFKIIKRCVIDKLT
ncbi:MAG: rod shape-determining protein MreD [Candidatus Omnitrophota bacterium]